MSNGKLSQRNKRAFFGLTKQEYNVAELVADGLTNKAIGNRLVLSNRTIEHHIHMATTKLGFDAININMKERHQRVLLARWMWEIHHELIVLSLN